jgi:hypothetical protein
VSVLQEGFKNEEVIEGDGMKGRRVSQERRGFGFTRMHGIHYRKRASLLSNNIYFQGEDGDVVG